MRGEDRRAEERRREVEFEVEMEIGLSGQRRFG